MRIFLTFFVLFISFFLGAQDSSKTDGYQIFNYPNGVKSSEGFMRDGKPDGYWKTYYESGVLKSEGNRKKYELDSLWKFYDSNGNIKVSISYKNGIQNGARTTYFDDKILVENFQNNIKHGISHEYYPNGKLYKTIPFSNGLEDGYAVSYSQDGRLIEIIFYQKGFQKNREIINRLDANGQKTGIWKEFWPGDNFITKSEIPYRKDIIDGYVKYFDEEGNLKSIQKFVNGILIIDPPELAEYELKTDFYSDGSIKTVGSYRDGIAEGVRRDYSPDGKITQAYIMYQGRIIGKGIIDENGLKQGQWIEYFITGQLKAEGFYKDNIKIGLWKYYFENGNLEQIGAYDNKGLSKGEWKWFYPNNNLRRIESFFEDINQGEMIEYASDSSIMVRGNFVDGRKEGVWIENINGFKTEGEYLDDVREGNWKTFYPNGNPYSEGKYIDDYADGIHIFYFENGNIMERGNFTMGLKNGEWRYFDEDGKLFIIVEYSQGVEIKYDTKTIEPEIAPGDMTE
jgi:uncharacterized protein